MKTTEERLWDNVRQATLRVLVILAGVAGVESVWANAAAAVNYRLTADDLVEIKVFQEPDLDARARVSGEGTINMALIGAVAVKGKTVEEAATAITAKLRDGYLVNPQVTVNVVSFSKRMFTVLGEVQTPGRFEIPDNREITLLDAIGMAGSYTGIANRKKIILKRRSGGQEIIREFNGKELARSSGGEAVIIQPGDVVTVPESIF
ncbi:MAG: polysaccharide biosynthesis/export family protein [Verrucomicrobiota bacterium]